MMDFVVNKIYMQIPRTYVNIVLLFNISQGTSVCGLMA